MTTTMEMDGRVGGESTDAPRDVRGAEENANAAEHIGERSAGHDLTGAQLRAARGLLDITIADLARHTGLAVNTIRRAEAADGEVQITSANALLLVTTLEAAGVLFIGADQFGPGVRLRAPIVGLEKDRPRRP